MDGLRVRVGDRDLSPERAIGAVRRHSEPLPAIEDDAAVTPLPSLRCPGGDDLYPFGL